MSFVGNQFQNGFDAAQRQGGVAKGFSGSHEVLTYEDIRFKGALGRKEAELFSQISPQETSYENHALVYVEESPLCYDTRVFEEKEEEEEYERQQRQQQSGGAKEEEEVKEGAAQATVVQRKNTMEMEHSDPRGTGTHSVDVEKVQKPAVKELRETGEVQATDAPPGKSGEVEEDQGRLVIDEEDISGDDHDEADVGGVPEPTIEETKGEVSDGRKRKSAPLSASVKEQVPEKKRTKSRKTSSEEKEKQKTAGPRVTRMSPRTAAVKLPNKKKFTHDELQLPSPEWKAYIVSMGKKEKNMVYHSPEGIICHSLEMVKGVESKRLESLKLKGALHGLMRSVGKLKRDPSAMDSLDAKHLSRDAVLLYRIWRARCHAEEKE